MVIVYESGKSCPISFRFPFFLFFFDNNTDCLITVRKAVSPQVGKVIQDLLALSDETDLEILNNSLEAIAEQFQIELLPVAAQLTARLV
jgi:hypothetical protein